MAGLRSEEFVARTAFGQGNGSDLFTPDLMTGITVNDTTTGTAIAGRPRQARRRERDMDAAGT